MKRVELFEFEDCSWFPSSLRAYLTNLIIVLQQLLGVDKALSAFLSKILIDQNLEKIVDLGSGSGGVMPLVLEQIKSNPKLTNITLNLTDKFPNKQVIKKYQEHPSISYSNKSVDAEEFEQIPKGLKTMINCFHHMPPNKAKKILASASAHQQPIFIYELSDNKIPFLLWCLFLPISIIIMIIMVLLMTPAVKSLSLKQIALTYIIPIIPIFYAWDGQASSQRIYALTDYDLLLKDIEPHPHYQWSKGVVKKENQKVVGTYLIGLPKV